MDREIFVQNVKDRCKAIGVKPTVACRESGVGSSFITELNRGQIPSVARVQMLATYLGMTTSELLGEESGPVAGSGDKTAPSPEEWRKAFSALSTEELLQVQELISREFGNRLK